MTRGMRDGVRADEVDLGALFGDAWKALRANLGAFFGAALLATVLLAFAAVLVGAAMWAQIEGHLDPALGLAGEYVGHAVLAVVGQWVLQPAAPALSRTGAAGCAPTALRPPWALGAAGEAQPSITPARRRSRSP